VRYTAPRAASIRQNAQAPGRVTRANRVGLRVVLDRLEDLPRAGVEGHLGHELVDLRVEAGWSVSNCCSNVFSAVSMYACRLASSHGAITGGVVGPVTRAKSRASP
jgi:hypothetical protein